MKTFSIAATLAAVAQAAHIESLTQRSAPLVEMNVYEGSDCCDCCHHQDPECPDGASWNQEACACFYVDRCSTPFCAYPAETEPNVPNPLEYCGCILESNYYAIFDHGLGPTCGLDDHDHDCCHDDCDCQPDVTPDEGTPTDPALDIAADPALDNAADPTDGLDDSPQCVWTDCSDGVIPTDSCHLLHSNELNSFSLNQSTFNVAVGIGAGTECLDKCAYETW